MENVWEFSVNMEDVECMGGKLNSLKKKIEEIEKGEKVIIPEGTIIVYWGDIVGMTLECRILPGNYFVSDIALPLSVKITTKEALFKYDHIYEGPYKIDAEIDEKMIE